MRKRQVDCTLLGSPSFISRTLVGALGGSAWAGSACALLGRVNSRNRQRRLFRVRFAQVTSDSENSSVLAIPCDIFESSKLHRFLGGAGHPFHGCIWLPARMDLVWSQRYSARYIRFCFGEPFQPLMPMDNLP